MVVVVVVAFYHLFFYWQYTHLPTKFFFWLGCLLALPPPPLRPCWPKMIKCHQSTTPRRRAWPGMLPRFARPGRGGPSFWGGGLVTLNHFWPARPGEGRIWLWIPAHRGQRSCRVEINVFSSTLSLLLCWEVFYGQNLKSTYPKGILTGKKVSIWVLETRDHYHWLPVKYGILIYVSHLGSSSLPCWATRWTRSGTSRGTSTCSSSGERARPQVWHINQDAIPDRHSMVMVPGL